jgi:quinoprotein glucose dehydrogenase
MPRAVPLFFVLCCLLAPLRGQQGAPANGEWPYWGGDSGSTRYSPLDQINENNVRNLRIAWRWKAQNFGTRAEFNWEVTPIMAGGVLYFTAGSRRDAIAVDAVTGETLWMYRLDEGARGSAAPLTQCRGLAYWSDGHGDNRIYLVSLGYHLIALNAATGVPIPGFGNKGIIDLFEGLDRPVVKNGQIGSTSPAIVVKDVVVVGSSLQSGAAPVSKENVPGYVRGFDARTGKLIWTFHTIPKIGEFGSNTWEKDSAQYTGNAAVWAPMSADQELGYVYLPVETPTGDFYGGHRPGDGLFGETLVCLDARTGKRIWHFQLIHHGVWDYDIPTAPNLLDITVNGKKIKAVAQVTKQAFTYVFDRVTGQPVWPIEERAVPQSDVPSEKTSLTQPFPTKPPAFDRQGVTADDLIDFTPGLKAEAVRIAAQFQMGPLFTPPSLLDAKNGGTLTLPYAGGGSNWQGAVVDPETGILYVSSTTNIGALALVHDPPRSDMNYVSTGNGGTNDGPRPAPVATGPRAAGPQGLPLVKPPWGRITAIDLNRGDHVWMQPNGEAPDYVRNHPALKGIDLSKTGRPERAPLLVTKSLLFGGDGSGLFLRLPGGGGPMFRALNKRTGEVIHEMKLPGNETGLPMTYMVNGKQFIVVAVAAPPDSPAELVALALP